MERARVDKGSCKDTSKGHRDNTKNRLKVVGTQSAGRAHRIRDGATTEIDSNWAGFTRSHRGLQFQKEKFQDSMEEKGKLLLMVGNLKQEQDDLWAPL